LHNLKKMAKIAVVLFNLGGPNALENVKPFLFNLFNDPLIIDLPQPFRYLLAKFISSMREKKSQAIYAQMGGKSTILDETLSQVEALQEALKDDKENIYKVLPLMRYWSPRVEDVLKELEDFDCDSVILLPLYPHYSTTTTLSSLKDWFDHSNLKTKVKVICCYYGNSWFIKAHQELIRNTILKINSPMKIRLLFSAHSIPEKIIHKGDPYQRQIEESVVSIMNGFKECNYSVCYQSKIGPLKWLEPSLKDAMLETKAQNEIAVVVPISFTSEHSEL
jgi:ferrochelatase